MKCKFLLLLTEAFVCCEKFNFWQKRLRSWKTHKFEGLSVNPDLILYGPKVNFWYVVERQSTSKVLKILTQSCSLDSILMSSHENIFIFSWGHFSRKINECIDILWINCEVCSYTFVLTDRKVANTTVDSMFCTEFFILKSVWWFQIEFWIFYVFVSRQKVS